LKRRNFLKRSAGLVAGLPLVFSKKSLLWAAGATSKIVIAYNPGASSFTGNADGSFSASPVNYWTYKVTQSVISNMVDQSIMNLTGASTVGLAWEAVIKAKVPSLAATTKIGIKINTAFATYPATMRCPAMARGEVITAIINGLHQMLSGTYNVENVTVFDKNEEPNWWQYMPANGFPAGTANVPYNVGGVSGSGQNKTLLADTTDVSTIAAKTFSLGPFQTKANETVTPIQTWLKATTDQAVLIDVAIPKVNRGSGVTGCMKNCYGMVADCSVTHPGEDLSTKNVIHDCVPRYYSQINALVPIAVNILDGLAGNYVKDAYDGPTFMANKIAMSTDPVTLDYFTAELVNAARTANGWAVIQTPAVTADRYSLQGAQFPGTVNVSTKKTYDTTDNIISTYVNFHSLAIAEQLGLGNMNAGDRIILDSTGTLPQELAPLDVPHGRPVGVSRTSGMWRLDIQLDRTGRTHRVESRIRDISGREIRSFGSRSTSFSSLAIDWDGRNDRGVGTARGVYCWEARIDGVAYSQTIHQL
jgi:Domain of unknown function (DUF362)